jgi:hypothetical protein
MKKKLLVLGLSACLLFSFTGSAFAVSPTNTKASQKTVHAAVTKKKAVKNLIHTKKQTVSHKNVNVKKAHKKAAKTAKIKVAKT